jgi:hypothetical protein
MKKILVLLAVVVLSAGAAVAQEAALTLSVRKTFGYAAGSQMQGTFRADVTGPADLARVTFTMDDATFATDSEPPFQASFNTGDYAVGWHIIGATGETQAGQVLAADTKRFEFIAPGDTWKRVSAILVPLFGVLGLVLLVSLGLPMLDALRGKSRPALPLGAPRDYGLLGGTICPKCGRPFGRHWWGFNLLTGKLDRCPHCGRWSIVRALPRDVLAQAEAAELAGAQPAAAQPALSEAEQRRRAIEESRFHD